MTKKEFIQQMMIHMASNSSFADFEEDEDDENGGFTYLEYGEMLCNAEIIADYMEEHNYGFDEEGN